MGKNQIRIKCVHSNWCYYSALLALHTNLNFLIFFFQNLKTQYSKQISVQIFFTQGRLCRNSIFSIMFSTTLIKIISTIYQKIGDLFYSLIFLDFHCSVHIVITIRARTMDTHFIEIFGAFVVFLANLIAPMSMSLVHVFH